MFPVQAKAQVLTGKYVNSDRPNGEYLEFKNDSINFLFNYGCCIVNEVKGVGKFEINGGKLFIAPKYAENLNKVFKETARRNDTVQVKISTTDNSKDLFATIILVKPNQIKNLVGIATNANGIGNFRANKVETIDSIKILKYGYRTETVKFERGFDYNFILSPAESEEMFTEVLNIRKGLKYKIKKNKIVIKRPLFIDHKKEYSWVSFSKQ